MSAKPKRKKSRKSSGSAPSGLGATTVLDKLRKKAKVTPEYAKQLAEQHNSDAFVKLQSTTTSLIELVELAGQGWDEVLSTSKHTISISREQLRKVVSDVETLSYDTQKQGVESLERLLTDLTKDFNTNMTAAKDRYTRDCHLAASRGEKREKELTIVKRFVDDLGGVQEDILAMLKVGKNEAVGGGDDLLKHTQKAIEDSSQDFLAAHEKLERKLNKLLDKQRHDIKKKLVVLISQLKKDVAQAESDKVSRDVVSEFVGQLKQDVEDVLQALDTAIGKGCKHSCHTLNETKAVDAAGLREVIDRIGELLDSRDFVVGFISSANTLATTFPTNDLCLSESLAPTTITQGKLKVKHSDLSAQVKLVDELRKELELSLGKEANQNLFASAESSLSKIARSTMELLRAVPEDMQAVAQARCQRTVTVLDGAKSKIQSDVHNQGQRMVSVLNQCVSGICQPLSPAPSPQHSPRSNPPSPLPLSNIPMEEVKAESAGVVSSRLAVVSARRDIAKQQVAEDGKSLTTWGLMNAEIDLFDEEKATHCLRPDCGCDNFTPHLNSVICMHCYHTAEEHGFKMDTQDWANANQQKISQLRSIDANSQVVLVPPPQEEKKKKKKNKFFAKMIGREESVATLPSVSPMPQNRQQPQIPPAQQEKKQKKRRGSMEDVKEKKTASQKKLQQLGSNSLSLSSLGEQTDVKSTHTTSTTNRSRKPSSREKKKKIQVKQEVGVVKFQSLIRGHLCRKEIKQSLGRANHCVRVIRELLQTEQVYVKSLAAFRKRFATPLERLTNAKDLKFDFSPIDPIISVHSQFLSELERALGQVGQQTKFSESPLRVGKLLRDLGPKLNVYSRWVNGYEAMMAAINAARATDKGMKKILDDAMDDSSLDISSYCIMPIQRIPRYELLIKDLLAHTDKDRIEYGVLRHAHTVIRDMADVCNEGKRKAEQVQKAESILSCVRKIPSSLLGPKKVSGVGRFVMEGKLFLYRDSKSGGLEARYFFLFSNVLLWMVESAFNGNSITYRGHLPLTSPETVLKPTIDHIKVQRAKAEVKEKLFLGLELVWKKKNAVYIFANDEDEKATWQDALVDCLKESSVS